MFFGTGTTSSVMQAAGAPGGGLSACPNVVVELVNTNARTPAASASLSRFSVPVMLGRPRAGEPVEHGDHQRVALPARGERFAQPGALAAGAGETVVDIHAPGADAEVGQRVALGGQVLLVGRHARSRSTEAP